MYANTSPYYSTSINGSYLDVINFRNIPNVSDDVLFTVTTQYANRPDLLAYDLYGNSSLWWVFSVRNKDIIKDPVYDLYAGQQIYLPQLATIKSTLGI
jgi:hypothetical protein